MPDIEIEIDQEVYLPCYRHLVQENDIDIELIWGGRDSGKSHHVAMQALEECLALDYFRCALVKQTHESIKDAQWQMIKDIADEWQVDPLMSFISSPLSIRCQNKNFFIARGLDKPGKIRGITNPSHVWIEEGNQISEDSFVTLLTTLRSNHGRVKLIITFNPEAECADYREFWLYKMFFAKHYPHELNFTDEIVMQLTVNGKKEEVRLKYRSTHVTYHDNPYVTPQRKAFHESLQQTNYYWYQVFTLGLWGNKENDMPWAFAYKREKHVSDGVRIPHPVWNRNMITFLAWDFNRNPMCCNVIQWDQAKQTAYVLEVIKIPKTGVDEMCDHIKLYYPGALYMVTGDYSGNTASSLYKEQVTHYKLIKHHLGLSDAQIKVKPNPRLEKNSTLVNSILAYYNVIIHGEKARPLVFDMENVRRRADGTILKDDRDNPAQQADSLDGFRYFCNMFLGWFKPG